MHPLLRLTKEELLYNYYYRDGSSRQPVIERKYPYSVKLTQTEPAPSIVHRTTRRARVFMVTFSGEVQGARVQLKSSLGETYLQQPMHIPLLNGFSPRSPQSVHPTLAPTPFVAPSNAVFSLYPGDGWPLVWDPNIIMPPSGELNFNFMPELPNDVILQSDGYLVNFVVHQWEFPGFQGGAV